MTSFRKDVKDFFKFTVKQDEWDMPPMLVVRPVGKGPQIIILDLDGIKPVEVVQSLADGFRADVLPEGKVDGVALYSEGWGLRNAKPGDAEWVQNHSIMDHPNGHELKSLAYFDGRAIRMMTFWRGDEDIEDVSSTVQIGGAVTESIKALFEAMNAR